VDSSWWSEDRFEFHEFEWDEKKAQANRKKHAIDFKDAAAIFRGPAVVTAQDQTAEDRWTAIRQASGRELVVVFTQRERRCRLISARCATRQEQERYYEIVGR
jgi:uncharacterized DUF497 family protein